MDLMSSAFGIHERALGVRSQRMEVIARNLAYEMMQSPAVMRQLAKQALKDWGLDDQEP